MEPSSLDFSILNSTSKLLSFLDLNEHRQQIMQNMDGLDIDLVMEVPDTPDRLSAQKINCSGEDIEKIDDSCNPRNSDLLDRGISNRARDRHHLTIENGNNRRFYSRHRSNSFRDEAKQNCHSIVTVEDSPFASTNVRLDKIIMDEKGSAQHHLDVPFDNDRAKLDGDTLSTAEILISDAIHDRNRGKEIDLISSQKNPFGTSYSTTGRSMRSKLTLRGNLSSNTDGIAHNNAVAGVDRGKRVDVCNDLKQKTGQIVSRSLQSNTSPRFNGQKRLVRNGCISPYNIARAKQTIESNGKGYEDCKPNDIQKVMSNFGIPSSQRNVVSPKPECNQTNVMDRVKGKGVIEELVPVKETDTKAMHLSSRRSLYHMEDCNGIEDASGDASRNLDGIGGWRSTRVCSKKISLAMSDEIGHDLSRRSDGVGHLLDKNSTEKNIDHMTRPTSSSGTDFLNVRNPVSFQPGSVPCSVQTPSFVSDLERKNRQHCGANKLMKRQRKRASARSNLGECSVSTFDESEVAYLRSSGELSDVRSTGSQNTHHPGISGPVIIIDGSSPEIRCRRPYNSSQMVNDDSDVKARQVEADEILARQLQEQFNHESEGVGGGEIDASIAWTLQQEEDAQHVSLVARQRVHPRDSSMSYLYRQHPPRSSQNSLVRSANRVRVPTSARMTRLRNSFLSHSPTVSSREGSSRFPPDMDIEMRIHILEALEAAVGNGNDMTTASHFLQVQREFNENDYEMLLSLDQDNHQHGASVNQINALPHSIVQMDNYDETCAICLETPTTGDAVRHLPCLHKFHKDCIDPWLRRRSSCPVCKSSIT